MEIDPYRLLLRYSVRFKQRAIAFSTFGVLISISLVRSSSYDLIVRSNIRGLSAILDATVVAKTARIVVEHMHLDMVTAVARRH